MGNETALRTVHGGAGSALLVEVSPVRGFAEGSISTCEEGRAEAFAVYIRNPLAFHVQDFITEGEERRLTLAEAKANAFRYADALAEHLGCEVWAGQLMEWPPAAPADGGEA